MKESCHLTLKDKTTLQFETLPVIVKENYVKIKPLINFSPNSFFISISHDQLNTFIDLTGFEPCVVLYFSGDQIFEGASYYSDSSDSFYCIQTQSKNIVIAKLPIDLPLNSLLNISTTKETLNFISYEDILSGKN
jgi:hypothetical protein